MQLSPEGYAEITPRRDMLDAILRDEKRLASLERRFWAKVEKRGRNDCWPWLAGVTEHGYGRMTAGRGINLKAPRAAFTIEFRISPGAWDVCHTCDNPPCCNHEHLFLGTASSNIHDAMAKGRMVSPPRLVGESHPRAVLNLNKAAIIRTSTASAKELAAYFGTSEKTIYAVRSGKAWSSQ